MKVGLLFGNQSNQIALCNKIAEVCDVSFVVLSANIPRKTPSFTNRLQSLTNRALNRFAGRELVSVWFQMLEAYGRDAAQIAALTIEVSNVNDKATLDAIEEYNPDYLIVSGTNLVGKKVIEAAEKRKGILNLHTGISPYIKGGPNCTNWCLANEDFHLIGNTIMWLDAGIDTGRIITTEQTPLTGDETLFELHLKVMQHAHDLYVRAVKTLASGKQVPDVPQKEIAEGKVFYNRDWNFWAARKAIANFNTKYRDYFHNKGEHRRRTAAIKLVGL